MADPLDLLQRDTRANQPAANTVGAGTLYCVTDEGNIVEQSDGAAWQPYSPASGAAGALDDLTDVDAPTPADGDVLTFNNGTGNWEAAAPSGGGGGSSFTVFSADVPPGSPSALDDRFPGSSLDAKWTIVDPQVAGKFHSTVNDGLLLRVDPTSQANKPTTLLQALPAGDFTAACAFSFASEENGNDAACGICLTDGAATTNKIYWLGWQGRGGLYIQSQGWNDYNSFSYQDWNQQGPAGGEYATIHRSGTTYTLGLSKRGSAWVEAPASLTFTPTHIGIFIMNCHDNVHPTEAHFRWFQYDASPTKRFGGPIQVSY